MLAIKWNDPGPAKDTIDLIPRYWFAFERTADHGRHIVVGKPGDGRGYAQCSISVKGNIVDLDYGGDDNTTYNVERGYMLGVTRLFFEDDGRTGLPTTVQWKYDKETDFVGYDVTPTERVVKVKDAAPFDPKNDRDGRKKIEQMVAVRQGQSNFRNALLAAYGGACAITGCCVEEVLQAAHIKPHLGDHTDYVTNGLLLRADIHTMFDLGIIKINRDYRITAHASIVETFTLPKTIPNLPKNKAHYPSPDAFDAKWA